MTTKKNLIAILRKIMNDHNLKEFVIDEVFRRDVLWYDNAGYPNEDPIAKLLWDGEELGLELSTFNEDITVYEDDAAFNDFEALLGILENILVCVCGLPTECFYDVRFAIEKLIEMIDNSSKQDEANSLIMEIACEVGNIRLRHKHNQSPDCFVEESEDDPDTLKYKECFQGEFDELYGEEMNRFAAIFGNGLDEDTGLIKLPIPKVGK